MNNWRAECQETGTLRSAGADGEGRVAYLASRLPDQVNRLKMIKRQMYGRANFDLLRKRVLHIA
jgi:hypothetical protein